MVAPLVVHLATGTPRRVEGLCTHCLLPALIEVEVWRLMTGGLSSLGTWRGCVDCRRRADPL